MARNREVPPALFAVHVALLEKSETGVFYDVFTGSDYELMMKALGSSSKMKKIHKRIMADTHLLIQEGLKAMAKEIEKEVNNENING